MSYWRFISILIYTVSVLVDFVKAFDSVSWDFLFKDLDFFNFEDSFINWVKLFYTKCQSYVIVNGHLSEWFCLQKGCLQGDPLSPYLFVICAEILATLIRRPDGIKSITIGNVEFLISRYADDTSFILDGCLVSLDNCNKISEIRDHFSLRFAFYVKMTSNLMNRNFKLGDEIKEINCFEWSFPSLCF